MGIWTWTAQPILKIIDIFSKAKSLGKSFTFLTFI